MIHDASSLAALAAIQHHDRTPYHLFDLKQQIFLSINQISGINDSFTLRETDSVMDSDSDPIPVVGSWDWNLNPAL